MFVFDFDDLDDPQEPVPCQGTANINADSSASTTSEVKDKESVIELEQNHISPVRSTFEGKSQTTTKHELKFTDAAGSTSASALQRPSQPSITEAKADDVDIGPKYWKVVRSIDAGGIAVRSDDGDCKNSRLPIGTIVLEKKRQGKELYFETLRGQYNITRSGWVNIESGGNRWMNCLGSDFTPPSLQSQQSLQAPLQKIHALFFIDWDDTLCPTSWLEECAQSQQDLGLREKLVQHAQVVNQFVQTAISLGTVILVTLADRPWVADSVRDFMPGAEVVADLDVYYAREAPYFKAPPGSDPLTALKRRAMLEAIEGLKKKLGAGITWESLISIGDSDAEKKAGQDLGRDMQRKGIVKWTKTVKMMDHPNIKQLTSQVHALEARLKDIVAHQGHKNMNWTELVAVR